MSEQMNCKGVEGQVLGRCVWAGFIKDASTPAEELRLHALAKYGFCLFACFFIHLFVCILKNQHSGSCFEDEQELGL